MPVIGTLWHKPSEPEGKIVSTQTISMFLVSDYFWSTQILAAAAWAGLSLDLGPYFKAKFPHGKSPAFESTTGFRLSEGPVIARYSEFMFHFEYLES
jgi:hypothetical protein